jgi:hypothetical protein
MLRQHIEIEISHRLRTMTAMAIMASVSRDCFVEFMFCVTDPALTSVEGFCLKARHCGAKQNRCEND